MQNTEVMLLSDVLGLSTLVDAIDHTKPPGATEATVLGPFHTDDSPDCMYIYQLTSCVLTPAVQSKVKQGESIASEGKGDYLFLEGKVLDLHGNPIPGAIIETWETDGHGMYDNQVRIAYRNFTKQSNVCYSTK